MIRCENELCEHNRGGCGICNEIENASLSRCPSCICATCLYCHDMKCISGDYRDPNSPETCNSFEPKCDYINNLIKNMG